MAKELESIKPEVSSLEFQTLESSVEFKCRLESLIELGREQDDSVKTDDILELFPEPELDISQVRTIYDAIYDVLEEEGIQIIEKATPDEAEENEYEPPLGNNREETLTDTEDITGLYIKEVGKVPLLSREEEVKIAKLMERGREAREELAQGPVLKKRKLELQVDIENDWTVREKLITANSRLVISVAKKHQGRGVAFLDLIQEGNIGLIRAAKKFDYRRGYKFSTYATWWIRQAVTRGIADHGRTIRVPVHAGDLINKALRVSHRLTQKLGHEPITEELAEAMGLPTTKVESLKVAAQKPLSLETPTDDEEDFVLGDFIEDDTSPGVEAIVDKILMKEKLERLLEKLPPRERRVLRMRYGLIDGRSYKLAEVGQKLGVTRERVRQIEAQALSRLRSPKVRDELQDYLEKR